MFHKKREECIFRDKLHLLGYKGSGTKGEML
jgi:hypothetical protein